MGNSMDVIKCGTIATPKLHNVECIITGISIRFNRCTYELSYFNNGENKTVWLDEAEFTVKSEGRSKIGFK